MPFLIFMDWLRGAVPFIVLAALFAFAGFLIRAPRMSKSWKRTVVRWFGWAFLGLLVICSAVLSIFVVLGSHDERVEFRSASGAKAALLSHSELRDSAATRVTVKGNGCCTQYLAYEYFGDGDDYADKYSVKWIDDHHLVIRYDVDPSGIQKCRAEAGDVQISCEPRPAPTFGQATDGPGSAASNTSARPSPSPAP